MYVRNVLAGLVSSLCIAAAQSPVMNPSPLQPQPTDPVQQQIRQARSALFDNLFGVPGHESAPPITSTDPKAPPPVTTEHLATVDELPGSYADTIVVGKIVSAQAFMSNDQRAIYTETTIQVENVISQIAPNAAVGKSLVLEQIGGELVLPTGRTLIHRVQGRGSLFQIGGEYAFFFTYVPAAQCYRLTKAWSLNGSIAAAMSPDDLARAAAGTSNYNGMAANAFIAALSSVQASYKGK